jgi:TPR repeat protein
MDYQLSTLCPNCFKLSDKTVCEICQFDKDNYLNHHAAAHHLPIFTRLNKDYVVGRVLGESEFSIVYAAIRDRDKLSCVIKEHYPRDLVQRGIDHQAVKPKQQQLQKQLSVWLSHFTHEAELLRSCYDHPAVESGIVHYTAVFKQHNTAYLVMERLSGLSIAEHLQRQHKFSADKICLWLKPLLETLQRLHNKEIYHRNISTHNIILTAPDKPVLLDFGLARSGVREALLKASITANGSFIAPEQISEDYADQRTDLYALGAVIYWCLHGEPPLSIAARKQGALLKTLTINDSTAQALQTVAIHCLQLNISLRPKDVTHLLAQLSPILSPQRKPMVFVSSIEAPPPVEIENPPVQNNQPNHGFFDTEHKHFELPSPLPVAKSFLSGLFFFMSVLCAFLALGYGAFIGYQHYDQSDTAKRKEDNLLFSQAQTLDEYKSYLAHCVTCENQQRAMERIVQLEKDHQLQLSQQKQQQQDAELFKRADTVEKLQAYLKNCVLCADKSQAEEKLMQLTEIIKMADETQLEEQEKELADLLKVKNRAAEFYQKNCPQQLPFWQRAAAAGYVSAQVFLGNCYRNGIGVEQDDAQALSWFQKAAKQGSAIAQYNTGVMYQNGYGVVHSEAEAVKWYQKAAEQGDATAQYLTGVMYEKGQGIKQDYKQAVDWYLRSAEQDNAEAEYSLGVLYHYGSG